MQKFWHIIAQYNFFIDGFYWGIVLFTMQLLIQELHNFIYIM